MGTGGIWRALRGMHDEQAEQAWQQHQRDQAVLEDGAKRQRDYIDIKLAEARAKMKPRPITAARLENLRQLQEPDQRPIHQVIGFDVSRVDPVARNLLIIDLANKVRDADARVSDTPQPPPGP